MEIKKKISQAEFQRLRRIVMSVDILVIGSLFFLAVAALYSPTINETLFQKVMPEKMEVIVNLLLHRFSNGHEPLFFMITMILTLPLLVLNSYYFKKKGEYENKVGITAKPERARMPKWKKLLIIIFIFSFNLFLTGFLLYNEFMKIISIPASETIMFLSFLCLPVEIASIIVFAMSKDKYKHSQGGEELYDSLKDRYL